MRKLRCTRILMVSIVAIALIVTSLSLVACNNNVNNNKTALAKSGDVFAFAGVSTGALLNGLSNNKSAMAGEVVEDEAIINELNEYMAMVESLVSGNPSNSEVKASDRAEYKTMQVMKVPSIDGTWTEYRLYYNEDAPKNDSVAKSDDDEYESHITGIMVIGDKEYKVKGDIEHEKDEQEIEFKAYLDDTEKNYIELSQELESKESEYEYSIYYDGKLDSSFSLEMETENYKNECEIETKNANGDVIEFKVEKDTTAEGKMKVDYIKGNEKGKFDVEATTDADGNAIYKYYFNGKEVDKDRD